MLIEFYEEALERGDGIQAADLLEKWIKIAPVDSNVHNMFYCRNRAYAALRVEKEPETARQWMQKALDITMPEWQERPLESYWISTMEMENLLAYAKTLLAIGAESELAEAERLLDNCRNFIDERVTDEEEYAKIYAKCACLLADLSIRQGKIRQAEQLAEGALQGLQTFGISYFMEPLLEILVQCNSGKNPYQKYLTALQHLKQYVGEEWHFADSLFKNCSQQTYYIDHELFREERIVQGYSQEQMIEGVYKNPESLSRAERGKVTMRDSKLVRLLRRLGIDKCRYNGFVVTDDYADLELKQKVDILLSRNCYKKAEELLAQLKSRLDLTMEENRRWISGYEIALAKEKDGNSKQELLNRALDILQETYQLQTHGAYRSPMDREVFLINQIGILLHELDRTEEAVQLFRCITQAMKNSKVNVKRRSRKYSLLRTNLAKWEASIPMAQENIRFTLECGKLRSLPMNYMTIASAMIDDPANSEICREMIKDCYYLCELVHNDVNKEITRNYYLKIFGEELKMD